MRLQVATIVLFAIFCAVNSQFDEKLASRKSIFISLAADSPFLDKCVAKAFDDGKTTLRATSECGPSPIEAQVCFGFVGYSVKQKVIYVGYRGSVSVVQLSYEVYRTVFEEQHDAKIGGKISAYFSIASRNLRSAGVNAEAVRLANKFPSFQLLISGHSLGGALASIAAGELIAVDGIRGERITLITFGEPRSGDSDYAEAFDKLVPFSYRVENRRDFFTQIPPHKFENYTHHKTEVWYPTGVEIGNEYKVCRATEDPKCQDSVNPALDPLDHGLYYYQVVPTALNGCQV
ncbi:unnamed protein product [Bursaphelenchus xylophilus]|uniref:(pine wood nematode) hypothetical protein n=1 Tax=Bursaphelenchus xylophilus TaxID=6326 RepID=A0A1I7SEV9_BURXY|nr:unnamed protein product [Bursaphelenchus xylophilus]CAG9113236.1 unnamed protein product [Bursaphelenchus xylophilus]